jgi:hypothetical protein
VRFNETGLKSRRVEIGRDEDEQEAMFGCGWSDGLPLVPPTEERVDVFRPRQTGRVMRLIARTWRFNLSGRTRRDHAASGHCFGGSP